jgi:hypothetical protein
MLCHVSDRMGLFEPKKTHNRDARDRGKKDGNEDTGRQISKIVESVLTVGCTNLSEGVQRRAKAGDRWKIRTPGRPCFTGL